jgi:glycosyltransferase involved in cell wall biosynthesis
VRILLFSNYYPEHAGGIETVAATLADGYRARGHHVHWIAADVSSCAHAGSADDVPVPAWNVTERFGFPYPLPSPSVMAKLRAEVAWAEVLHMHDCLYAINVVGFVAARRMGRPILITQHIANVPYPNPLLRGLQSLAYATFGDSVLQAADQVVFISPKVQDAFEARLRLRRDSLLIPNGLNSAVFKPVDQRERATFRAELGYAAEQPLVLFVGQFKEKKGVSLLRPVVEATPEWSWLMVGRPAGVDPRAWPLPNLRVLSPVKPHELRTYFGAADVVVLPGREAFPIVAQESMACGTPVVLSHYTADGIPEIRDLVFRSAPEPVHLRASISEALGAASSSELRQAVARYAHDHWSADVMVGRYEALLSGLLSHAASASAPRPAAGRTD